MGRGAHTLDSQTPRRVVTVAAAAAARSQCWKRQDSRQSCPCSCSCPTVPALPSAAFVLLHFTLLLALARGRTRRERERSGARRLAVRHVKIAFYAAPLATCLGSIPACIPASFQLPARAAAAAVFAFTLAVKIIIIKTKSSAQMRHSWRRRRRQGSRAWASESALEKQLREEQQLGQHWQQQ